MSTRTMTNRFAKQPVRKVRWGITRGQAILFFAAFTLFFYTLTELVFASEENDQHAVQEVQPVVEVTVQPGDSLWTIAVAYQGDSTKDVRDLVYQIQKWNKLDGAIIHPGQTIEIPLQP
ncbi:LysM peptidoglycan-binding domain-containing protein [Brevibacillus composti]|uniref:LysM peptidoglycan-binding domain-containing protein n=1 Tax=Brevibacillus composti TaxID=2796470 RepID=A0A7T5EP80_9BACL|nr:LysM peptidoglycan-binding domain-containing protein [Brevibacillus composti]QQE76249.1 LysM peptidoglycan-binding domain-containing protein [Brevibacillus composti]QUO43277.1 LysM peptidoglycan-binding domain-containing protein [Brevibacillus composti]